MNKKRGHVIKSKLKLKGKFGKNRRKKEEMVRQQLLQEKERELLASMNLFSPSGNADLMESSKDLQQKVFEDPFVKDFIDKVNKSTEEEYRTKLASDQKAAEITSKFSVSSVSHTILELTQSISPFEGKGRIITSGKACHGKGTCFLKEAIVGDVIMVERSGTFKVEKRIVNGVLSDGSLCLSTPFKPGVSSFSKYKIKPKGTFFSFP